MSSNAGYHLGKTGERVKQLLDRHYIVPTLDTSPEETTLSWQDGKYTVLFRIGEFVRVSKEDTFIFYQLKDIKENKAVWAEASEVDLSDYYTKKQIDDKLRDIIISGGGGSGGVEIVTPEEYEDKKNSDLIIDNIIYLVIKDNEPYEMYVGLFLIAKKGELQNISFPYSFPITF